MGLFIMQAKITSQEVQRAEQMIRAKTGRSLKINTPETVKEDKENDKTVANNTEKKVEVAKRHSDKQKASGKMHHGKEFAKVGRGENVAAGQQNLVQAVQSWLKSPGHLKNIKNASNQIAVARSGSFWTMIT